MSFRRRTIKVALAATLVAAVGLSVGPACSGLDERPAGTLVIRGGIYLNPETLEPYSGLAMAAFEHEPESGPRLVLRPGTDEGRFTSPSGGRRLSSVEAYENGVKHGPYAWYFPTGQLFEEGTYVDGRLHGPYRAYWEDGELYEEGTYRRGHFDGPRRWYVQGRLIELVTYRRGVVEGLYERYPERGVLDLKGMLQAGEPCGTWIQDRRAISYPACESRAAD